jgi:hypothetical protein
MLRGLVVLAGLLAALPALAGEMTADEARSFVVGKMFSYHCFEGTRGQGLVYPDGSVAGSIQFQGEGRVRYAALPTGTLQVRGQTVCASLRGLPIQPCFDLERTGSNSFRGSISGLGFAYCTFTRRYERAEAVQNSRPAGPLALRPSLAAESE